MIIYDLGPFLLFSNFSHPMMQLRRLSLSVPQSHSPTTLTLPCLRQPLAHAPKPHIACRYPVNALRPLRFHYHTRACNEVGRFFNAFVAV
jgi:hypothetical protein